MVRAWSANGGIGGNYPCRSMESAIKLVERFNAGVTKPARPSIPEDAANPHQYDGPPRTAEQVAA